jgi:hypothetical protein
VVWDKSNKIYGVVLNNYGDESEGGDGELRLDSDGVQSIFTYDKESNQKEYYNLVPFGSIEDEGNGNLQEAKESAKRIIELAKSTKNKEHSAYYEDIYSDLLSGKFDKKFADGGEVVIYPTDSNGKTFKWINLGNKSQEGISGDISKKMGMVVRVPQGYNLFVLESETQNKKDYHILAQISTETGEIEMIKGKFNSEPSSKYQKYIDDLINKFNFSINKDNYADGGDIGENLENYSNYDEFYNVVFDYIKREENLTEEETKDICNVNESIIEAEFEGGSSPRFTGDVVLGYLSNERAYKNYAKGGKTGLTKSEIYIIDDRIEYYFNNNEYTDDSELLASFVIDGGKIDYSKYKQILEYIESQGYAGDGGIIGIGRYSILAQHSNREEPLVMKRVNNRNEIAGMVDKVKLAFKKLGYDDVTIFVTDEETDDEVYNYAEGGVTKKRRRSASVQYGGSDRLIDKQRSAKPVGYRFTDTFAKKKRKVNHAIPKKEEIKQFLGKGIYKESRRNRSDISRKVKL